MSTAAYSCKKELFRINGRTRQASRSSSDPFDRNS